MAIYSAICSRCGSVEISKPMAAAFPTRHVCGGTLTRRFTDIPVIFAAPGFYSTDVSHFQKQLGAKRFAKFEHDRASAVARAYTGKLTPYERKLATV